MAVAEKQIEPRTITRALRVEIVKPIGCTWDDVGPVLRAQRSIIHRLYTAAALGAIESDKRSSEGEAASICKRIMGKSKKKIADDEKARLVAQIQGAKEAIYAADLPAKTAAYQAVEDELTAIREWAAKKKPRTPELDRLATLVIPGGTKSAIGAAAFTGFQKWRKDKGKNRVPTWKYGAPIPVRAAESGLRIDDKGGVVLNVKLDSGRREFLVKAGKGAHWKALRRIASGDPGVKLGEVRLKKCTDRHDKSGRKKWFAFVAYTEAAPFRPSICRPEHAMVVHRGERNLLVCATNEGRYLVLATGNKLRAQKRAFKARRESLQARALAERGTGSSGHGRARRYSATDVLSQKEANAVHTLCQQLGARVAQLAKEWGCGSVYIEKFGGIGPDSDRGKRKALERFPYHDLKLSVEWALRKAGLGLDEYDHEYISQTCPACGNVDAAQVNRATGIFHCRECAFDRPVDFVAAIHALRQVGDGSAGDWEGRIAAAERLRQKVRKEA